VAAGEWAGELRRIAWVSVPSLFSINANSQALPQRSSRAARRRMLRQRMHASTMPFALHSKGSFEGLSCLATRFLARYSGLQTAWRARYHLVFAAANLRFYTALMQHQPLKASLRQTSGAEGSSGAKTATRRHARSVATADATNRSLRMRTRLTQVPVSDYGAHDVLCYICRNLSLSCLDAPAPLAAPVLRSYGAAVLSPLVVPHTNVLNATQVEAARNMLVALPNFSQRIFLPPPPPLPSFYPHTSNQLNNRLFLWAST
jgi:hypothetical protein